MADMALSCLNYSINYRTTDCIVQRPVPMVLKNKPPKYNVQYNVLSETVQENERERVKDSELDV